MEESMWVIICGSHLRPNRFTTAELRWLDVVTYGTPWQG